MTYLWLNRLPILRHLEYIIILLLACSCSNDFNVVIPAKPTTFVYCVLNTTDTVHYLRINRSFITADNVYDYVNCPDSLYHDELVLRVELIDKDSHVVEIEPDKIIYASKDSGLFARDPNILYAFHADLPDYVESRIRLIIPPDTGIITATTSIIADTGKFLLPGHWSPGKKINFFGEGYNMKWETGSGAYHSMSYTFHYRDFLDTDTISRSFEFMFQSELGPKAQREFCLRLEDFLYTIKSRIPDRPEVQVRIFDSIDFEIESADKFLYEYANLFSYNPSEFALINFTNIQNGSGIFSSRSSIHHTGMGLDVRALDAIINSPVTRHLRFVRYE